MDSNRYFIKSYCSIKNNTVSLNENVIYQDENAVFLDFIKSAYKNEGRKYPKFFKMDGLSKLGFLAADILLHNEGVSAEKEANIALVFANRASSLDTDRKHQSSIQNKANYFPSPAVFVYTLPNICIGEISIKYKLYSENSFFIFDNFNATHFEAYTNSLLNDGKAEQILCGWVEYEGNDNYEALLYLVAKKGSIAHNKNEIIKLYNK